MKTVLPLVLISLLAFNVHGQQDPLYAQYYNSPLLINPSFAGSIDRLFAGIAYRSQWSGLEGAPASYNFTSHIALVDNKVGAGVVVAEDRLGEFKTTRYGAAFAYRINWTDKTSVAFGMQAGVVTYATDMQGVRALNPDNRFLPFSETRFNTGAGVLIKGERFKVGLSVPQFLDNNFRQGEEEIRITSHNYYAYGSYLFFLTEHVELKPSALLRFTGDTPPSMDVNVNLTFDRLYTGGVFTRNLNTYGLLLQLVRKDFRFSYVFEMPGNGSALNFNTHEIGFALSMDVLGSHDHMNTGF